jgi:hypothetical protein
MDRILELSASTPSDIRAPQRLTRTATSSGFTPNASEQFRWSFVDAPAATSSGRPMSRAVSRPQASYAADADDYFAEFAANDFWERILS